MWCAASAINEIHPCGFDISGKCDYRRSALSAPSLPCLSLWNMRDSGKRFSKFAHHRANFSSWRHLARAWLVTVVPDRSVPVDGTSGVCCLLGCERKRRELSTLVCLIFVKIKFEWKFNTPHPPTPAHDPRLCCSFLETMIHLLAMQQTEMCVVCELYLLTLPRQLLLLRSLIIS